MPKTPLMPNNFIDGFAFEIQDDDDNHERESDKLTDWLGTLKPEERAIINEFTTRVCGWGLQTLERRYERTSTQQTP